MSTLLIDADYIVYKSCASAEYDIDYGEDIIVVGSRFSEAYANVQRDLIRLNLSSLILMSSCSSVIQLTFVSQLIHPTKDIGTERNLVDTKE
jgi:hypothetical protein